ncbi:MAG: glycerate kinase [Candidatus Melainabacteria bacterium]|nr:glycerate kinase [Candidatus Melainabacteria bacterium]
MRKILIAPTAFKGTLTPSEVAQAIACGITESGYPAQLILTPVADGGDGTIDALHMALGGKIRTLEVTGPVGQPVMANWLCLPNLTVIELASASGLTLIGSSNLAPLEAHTLGTGQVLRQCLSEGKTNIVVTVGGSASTDGGTGLLRALGARFLNIAGQELSLGGGSLINLSTCDLTHLMARADATFISVATDVKSPLLGKNGAAYMFAPQKGANAQEVLLLERGLNRLADVLESLTLTSVRNAPGAGAAGGTAFGLACVLGANIVPGFAWVAELVQLDEKLKECDLVISAEGKLDKQSAFGKVVGELAVRCARLGRRLWVLAAVVEPGIQEKLAELNKILPVARQGQIATAADLTNTVRDLFREMDARRLRY